jgi:peroxiredoxin
MPAPAKPNTKKAPPSPPEGNAQAGPSTGGILVQLAFIGVAAFAAYGLMAAAKDDQVRTSCSALCSLAPNYAGRDRTAPDFELPDMDGKPVKLSSFRGKTVILNFWTISCGPCKEEAASIAELYASLKKRKDIVLLTVSTDDGPDTIRDWLKVKFDGDDHPFPILFDPDLKVVKEKFGTELFPETWIIDPKGVIRARFDGARDWGSALGLEIAEMVEGLGKGCPLQVKPARPVSGQGAGCTTDADCPPSEGLKCTPTGNANKGSCQIPCDRAKANTCPNNMSCGEIPNVSKTVCKVEAPNNGVCETD